MWGDWLTELGLGILKLFLNPLLYWIAILAVLASWKRIKKDQRFFGGKVFDYFAEMKGTMRISLVGGVVLSVLSLVIGVVYSYSLIIMLSVMMIVLTLNARLKYSSAAYSFGLTFLGVLFLPTFLAGNFPQLWVTAIADTHYFGFLMLMGAFLIMEATMLLSSKSVLAFPERMKEKKGHWRTQYQLKKLAVIPVLLLVPGGGIDPVAEWWPVINIAEKTYGLIILPFITGFEYRVKGQNPIQAAKRIGTAVFVLGIIIILLAIGSIYWRPLTVVAIGTALAGRAFIYCCHRAFDKKRTTSFRAKDRGLPILAVIPESPADRLGLKTGETIEKMNGERVKNEEDFYQALQQNDSFCKLEVRDGNDELRVAEGSLTQKEHRLLGILFGEKQK